VRRRVAFAVAVALVALTTLFLFFPHWFLGVSADALASSVERAGRSAFADCDRRGVGWECSVFDARDSTTAEYDVRVKSDNCWTGHRVGGGEAAARLSGCVRLRDHIGLNH
jgi:hypothetical protein